MKEIPALLCQHVGGYPLEIREKGIAYH